MKLGMHECKQCIGIDNCNKYCSKKAGKTLADYIINIDKVETDIGELRKPSKPGGTSLIVIGHMVSGEIPTFIMKELTSDIRINSNNKFKTFKGKNIIGVLKSYTNTLNQEIYKDRIAEVTNILKLINHNKILVLPIKICTEININKKDNSGDRRALVGEVTTITWKINNETGKLEAKIAATSDNKFNNSKSISIDLTNYGEEFEIKNITEPLKTAEIQPEFTKMTDEGMIRPTVIVGKNVNLAIDCRHLYLINNDETLIIGKWTDKGLDEFGVGKDIKTTKAYKKLKDAIRYIESHKKYIAPLGLIEENIIDEQ